MKLVYLGSPEAAVAPLRSLVAAGHDVLLVVSQPDRRRGRGNALTPSPVKAAAMQLGLPTTDRVDDVLEAAADGAELGIVVAFGRLIKSNLLDALPFVNLHFSLLPRWRGAAPVERSLLAGDAETGVCLMALEAGLDTGDVYRRVATPIGGEETADELRARLVDIGSAMLVDALASGSVRALGMAEPQVGEPTWATKLVPEEFELDWSRSAVELHRLVRVRAAWTTFREKRFKVHRIRVVDTSMEHDLVGTVGNHSSESVDGLEVTCGHGIVQLIEVQPEGRSVMSSIDWRNGAKPHVGERFGAFLEHREQPGTE